ncbi:hypothetical protein JCM10295v2_002168 [Rhodotorula toruloides]
MPEWKKLNVFKSKKGKDERVVDGNTIAPHEKALMGNASAAAQQSRVGGDRLRGVQLLQEHERRRRRRPSNESGDGQSQEKEEEVGTHTDSEAGDGDDFLARASEAIDDAYRRGLPHKKPTTYSTMPPKDRAQPRKAPTTKEEFEALRQEALQKAKRRRRREGEY